MELDPCGEIGVFIGHPRTRLLKAISIVRSIAGCAGLLILTFPAVNSVCSPTERLATAAGFAFVWLGYLGT